MLKTWRFITIMVAAGALAAPLAHLMELPGKMTYDARLYVLLHRTLYPTFGHTEVWVEGFALISIVALAWRVRKRELAFPFTVIAATCALSAMAVFLIFIYPVNVTMSRWPLNDIPQDWMRWRNQWEYAHAARAFLQTGTISALIISLLRESPREKWLAGTPVVF